MPPEAVAAPGVAAGQRVDGGPAGEADVAGEWPGLVQREGEVREGGLVAGGGGVRSLAAKGGCVQGWGCKWVLVVDGVLLSSSSCAVVGGRAWVGVVCALGGSARLMGPGSAVLPLGTGGLLG